MKNHDNFAHSTRFLLLRVIALEGGIGLRCRCSTSLNLDDLEWNLQHSNQNETSRKVAYRLTLCLKPYEGKYPYSFELVVVGHFSIADIVPDDRVVPVLDSNAPALLYGAAREMLATSLGRGPFSAPVLPGVHFMDTTREPQVVQSIEE